MDKPANKPAPKKSTTKPTTKEQAIILKTPVKKEPQTSKIVVANTDIIIGRKYTLSHKFDASAPDGMKEISATKFPFEGNDTKLAVYFDESRGQYDTGFYYYSKCNGRIDENILVDRVDAFNRIVRRPYEIAKNVDLEENGNNPFWKEYRVDLYVNKEFDTRNPIELFDLYNTLQQGYACQETEDNPFYRTPAMFTIANPTDVKNKVKDKTAKKIKAWSRFTELSSTDREKLDVILLYLNKGDASKIKTDDLVLSYYNTFNGDSANFDTIDKFNDACDKYNEPSTKAEMEYFIVADKLSRAGKIKKVGGKYMTADEQHFLGNSLQDVAKFCRKDADKREIVSKLYESILPQE